MDFDKVMKLVDAGFSKEEIFQMLNPETEQKQEQKEEQKEEPKQEQKEEPKQEQKQEQKEEHKQEQQEEHNDYSNSDILEAIAKLTSVIQANAIKNSMIPKQHTQEDAESIMASIIRPNFSGG